MMQSQPVTLLDGGMGRELARIGAPFKQPEWSALAMIESPDSVLQVHRHFIDSGARIITTNSYALVPFHLGEQRFLESALLLATEAGKVARQAVTESGKAVQVAASLPPMFGSYRPDLYQRDDVANIATPLIKGLAPYADIWLAETQSLITEALDIKALTDQISSEYKPFWVAFTLDDENPSDTPLLRSGEPVEEAVVALANAGVEAILFNCSQPEVIEQAVEAAITILRKKGANHIQVGAYANAFPPQTKEATANEGLDDIRADLTPDAYLAWADKWRQLGASLIGGCCGIGPEHINKLHCHLIGE
ncbi:homocysteine S-methyltransferase family protein [Vibrio olivae]|uniref:Homocysteine S-methyltransferase family protein n=1 Tax=Vibrio olivae TaxID=1243002 RepID=A0ABV5HQP3_9VIBR